MLKRLLTYFVLIMVVVQSVTAMADVHQQHQADMDHLVFDEAHQHEAGHPGYSISNNHSLNDEASSEENSDCDHCCHCHGHASSAIVACIERVHFAKNSGPIFIYVESTMPVIFETFLRPPIA